MQTNLIDISEYSILDAMPEVLDTLLRDQTLSGPDPQQYHNIRWLTADYAAQGEGYAADDEMRVACLSGRQAWLVLPRALRVPQPADAGLDTWQLNAQLNAEEREWFDGHDVFNVENPDHTWSVTRSPIQFPRAYHRWRDYILLPHTVAPCGEGELITSRYDLGTQCFLPTLQRIGLLDRKLRIVTERCRESKDWLHAAKAALASIYGYALRGDEVFLCRQAMLYTLIEWYLSAFDRRPQRQTLLLWARIISWNVWQMDASSLCVPGTSIYCLVRNWRRFANRSNKFVPADRGYDSETYYEQLHHHKPEPAAEAPLTSPQKGEAEPEPAPAPAAPMKKPSRRKKTVETQQEIDWDALF